MLLLTQFISLEVAETSTVTNMEHIVTTTLCILMTDKTKDVRIKITIEIRDSKVMCRWPKSRTNAQDTSMVRLTKQPPRSITTSEAFSNPKDLEFAKTTKDKWLNSSRLQDQTPFCLCLTSSTKCLSQAPTTCFIQPTCKVQTDSQTWTKCVTKSIWTSNSTVATNSSIIIREATRCTLTTKEIIRGAAMEMIITEDDDYN